MKDMVYGVVVGASMLTAAGCEASDLAVLNSQLATCRSTLHAASSNGDVEAVALLIADGVKLDEKDDYGRTPLNYAAAFGHVAVAELLLEKGAKIDETDDYGRTSLHRAADEGHTGGVRLLCEYGAKLDEKSKMGLTPLHYASGQGHVDVVKVLLEKGANLAVKDEYGWTPLHWAACEGRVGVLMVLFEHGSNPDEKGADGKTPLHGAAYKGHAGVADMLLEKGAKLDEKDVVGLTPLHYASGQGHEGVVKLLLEKGASLGAKNNSGGTPLHGAVENSHVGVVKLLLKKGAKPEEKNVNGETPLHEAASSGSVAVVKLLLKKGAKPEEKNVNGETPLWIAARFGCGEVAKHLLLGEAMQKVLDEPVLMLFAVMYCHLRKLPAPKNVAELRTAEHRMPQNLLKMILGWCPDTRYAILAGKGFPKEFEKILGDCAYQGDEEIQAIERSRAEEGMPSAEIIEVTMKEAYAELAKLNREASKERYKLLIKRLFNGQVRRACLQLIKDSTTGQEIYFVGVYVAPRYEEKVKRVIDTLCAESPKVKDDLLRMKPSFEEVVGGMKEIFNEHWRFLDASGICKTV